MGRKWFCHAKGVWSSCVWRGVKGRIEKIVASKGDGN